MALGFGLVPNGDAGGGAGELLLELAFGMPCCIPRVSTRSHAAPMFSPAFNAIAVATYSVMNELGLV
jgi:hypothetical protein